VDCRLEQDRIRGRDGAEPIGRLDGLFGCEAASVASLRPRVTLNVDNMRIGPCIFRDLLVALVLCASGCTFGLVHTRESDRADLYLQSAADTYQEPAKRTDPRYDGILGYLKKHPDVSAILVVASSGHHLEVISPEGIFPEWGDVSIFELSGSGTIEVSDGTEWMCYELPGSASSRGKKYANGTIRLARDYTAVILDLRMSSKYWFGDWVNHSGQYKISSVKGSADKAPDLTASAGTSAAEQPRAPASSASHL